MRRQLFTGTLACSVTLGLLALAPAHAGARSAATASASAIQVGIITSKTGPLASYGAQYLEGLSVGLAYATNGTDTVAGHKIQLAVYDDAGSPVNAVSTAKDLIGRGYKILAGSASSGVALQVAPLAAQNRVLFISGPAAADKVTGINKYTFRSGRQSYQDIRTAASFIGSARGKTITVFAQDSAFGQANVAAVTDVLGAQGATVNSILVPPTANDFTPFALRARQARPRLIFVAWAGTNAPAMWQSLSQQGVFSASTVVTGLDLRASYGTYGAATANIQFLSHYFYEAPHNAANTYLINALKRQGKVPDLFDPDGFVAGEMIARAVQQSGGSDVDAMVKALEGWSFLAPKGQETVRASDHAMLQPMFPAQLVKSGSSYAPRLVKTLAPGQTAPPATS